MMEIKNLVSEISNELAIAILVEKRHSAEFDGNSVKDFIERVKCELADQSDENGFGEILPNNGLKGLIR